jgi:hypothetical protein
MNSRTKAACMLIPCLFPRGWLAKGLQSLTRRVMSDEHIINLPSLRSLSFAARSARQHDMHAVLHWRVADARSNLVHVFYCTFVSPSIHAAPPAIALAIRLLVRLMLSMLWPLSPARCACSITVAKCRHDEVTQIVVELAPFSTHLARTVGNSLMASALDRIN